MLVTLLNWIYIFITLYICGHFAYKRLYKFTQDAFPSYVNLSDSLLLGFAVLTAFSGYFSLITGVGIFANILLLLLCALFVFLDRKDLSVFINRFKSIHIVVYIFCALILIVCLYFTAYAGFDYDTGLYHAQSIHWIEEYGVLPGLAYMQTRLGFNSSFFCISALYSFHDFGKSLHSVNGFLMLCIMTKGINGILTSIINKPFKLSKLFSFANFINLTPFIYFIMVCYELSSPTTDCASNCLLIWLFMSFAEAAEASDNKVFKYSFLSIIAVFLVSIKLSVGVIALIVVLPAIALIKQKKWKDIITYMVTGIVLVMPYFIRNIIITGWLIYPFPALDIFNFDWKIPYEGVKYESEEVIVWARFTKDTALIDQKMNEWLPVWWDEQGQINRFISTSAFIGSLVSSILLIAGAIIKGVRKQLTDKLFFVFVILISFSFWMISAPSNRFGYAYLITVALMGIGLMCDIARSVDSHKLLYTFTAITIVTAMISLLPMAKGLRMQLSDDYHIAKDSLSSEYLISQRDYTSSNAESKEWNGFTIYYPSVEGSQIWYDAFPAILYEGNLEGIEMRGDTIKKGFKLK